MYNTIRIQVQFITANGRPIGDWRDQSHLNYPTDAMITNHMQTAKRCWKDARVRAVDDKGRIVDMLYA